MDDFDNFKDHFRTFVLDQGGCETKYEQPYRHIRWDNITEGGVTFGTAQAFQERENFTSCESITNEICTSGNITVRVGDELCHMCSQEIATSHETKLLEYKKNITEASLRKCYDGAIIAGLISKLTDVGEKLDPNGLMECTAFKNTDCFGLLQIPVQMDPVMNDGIGGVEYFMQAIDMLIGMLL